MPGGTADFSARPCAKWFARNGFLKKCGRIVRMPADYRQSGCQGGFLLLAGDFRLSAVIPLGDRIHRFG